MSKLESEHSVFFEQEPATASGEDAEIKPRKSNLDLINECDNFPYYTTNPAAYTSYTEGHYHLLVQDHIQTLGLIPPSVAEVFRGLPAWELDDKLHTLTLVGGNDHATRSAIVASTTTAMRATGHFAVLDKWRNELYPVYGEKGDILFDIERSASPLFGVVTYGAHLTAFVRQKRPNLGDEFKIWIARRSKTKQTYPGMLDNTVGGGLSSGETPFPTIVRESHEEASLPIDMVEQRAKAAGVVSYFHMRDARAGGEVGLMQPECEYSYDLELDDDVVLKPNDDEVESFELLGTDEVQRALATGQFKPNCALVLLDFFVRHGVLTPENERNYTEIVARLHRMLEFPVSRF